jgi:fucose permease
MAALFQLVGLVLIVVGAWLIYPPAAVVLGGVFMVALGVALERVRNARTTIAT